MEEPTWSPDSYSIWNQIRQDIQTIRHSALNQLTRSYFFASSYIKLIAFFGWYWPHLNISWLIFLNPLPVQSPELIMYACFGFLIHPLHIESRQSKTHCQLSQRGVRLHVNWVHTKETPHQLSQRRRHQHLLRFDHSALTQLTWSLTPHWLSQRWVSPGVDSLEWDSVSTESPPILKNLSKSANLKTKWKTLKSLIIWLIYVWSVQKTRAKKSHASVPLNSYNLKAYRFL
jgi:hypothetical protein